MKSTRRKQAGKERSKKMARILSKEQNRKYEADMAELARYRAIGIPPEKIEELLFPEAAPLPLI